MSADEDNFLRLAAWLRDKLGFDKVSPGALLAGGNVNVVRRLETEIGPVILRHPPADAISPKSAAGIGREVQVMRALAATGRAPQLLAYCDDPAVIGVPFMIAECVDGVAITDQLPDAYLAHAGTVTRIGEELVDALACVHSLDWRAAGLKDFGNPQGWATRQVQRWLDLRAREKVRELPLFAELGEWLLANVPAQTDGALIHGDYHLDNTLFAREEPRLRAIIDWELSAIADPLLDLGLMLMFWGERSLDVPAFPHVQAVTRGAGPEARRHLAARWSAATGRSLGGLPFYGCLAFWRLAGVVEGAFILNTQGRHDTAYARQLEANVPRLLAEAEAAASGRWS